MNFAEPISALFPGASGRIVTALARHQRAGGERLTLAELSTASSVVASQLETVLFRLGLLGVLTPRARGEDVRLVTGHLVWRSLEPLLDPRPALLADLRARALRELDPPPPHLTAGGAVADGTATGPSGTLHLSVVAPGDAPATWVAALDGLVARLSTDLGNIVTYSLHTEVDEGPGQVTVLP